MATRLSTKQLIKGVDYIEYDSPDDNGNIVECNHCHAKLKNASYMKYQHGAFCPGIKKQGIDIRRLLTSSVGTKSGDEVQKLRQVVRCICENCISLNATQSKSFREATNSSYAYETIRNEIIRYADSLKEHTRCMIRNKFVSIVIDGATITTSGWYCVGIATATNIYYYDCYHLASGTTRCITEQLETVIKEIEEKSGAIVVGACSDNASNVTNVFDPSCPDSLITIYDRKIIRVSCQAHTANLVLASYERNDPSFGRLRSRIRGFARELHSSNIHELLGIRTRCPPIREQRWFTDYIALDWICKNEEKLRDGFNNIKHLLTIKTVPIKPSWFELRDALAPLYFFTTMVEGNMVPLGKGFKLLVAMKMKLASLSNSGNQFAKDLLAIVDTRWSTTAEEPMMKLANFIRKDSLYQWREKYNSAKLYADGPLATSEQISAKDALDNEVIYIQELTVHYGELLGYDFSDSLEEIKFLIHTANPKYSISIFDHWFGVAHAKKKVCEHAEAENITLNEDKVQDVAMFYCKMLSLPSTEAYCERVFKNMRELFDFNRKQCSDDLIKAQTIIKMNILMEKENFAYVDDLEIDVN